MPYGILLAMVSTGRILRTLGGPRVLRRSPRTLDALRQALREGLPYGALVAVSTRFRLSQPEVVAVLAMAPRTLARRKAEQRLHADESDRLFRLGRIATLAEDVLGGREKATSWLHRPNRALGNQPPLQQLDSDLGTRRVEDLLLRIAHGVYS
jgi:putative toxin-antitoxin system antitoxin component (TIGR02293 family)